MAEEQRAMTLWSGQHMRGIIIEGVSETPPETDASAEMWVVIYSRKDMSRVADVKLSKLDAVPAELAKYAGNHDYLMLVATFGLNNVEMIRGDLYDFFNKNGGGGTLHKMVQTMNAVPVSFGYYSYCLASVMGTETGFEAVTYSQGTPAFLPLKLEKIADLYTPLNTFPQ